MIEPADILALLEPGPRLSEELALDLAAPLDLVKNELTRLVRAGVLKRRGAGSLRNYAFASYVPKPGRPMLPGRQRIGIRKVLLCAGCHRRHPKYKGLCRLCARSGGLSIKTCFELDRERVQRREARAVVAMPQQFAVPRASQARACIVEGQEFEVVDFDALLAEKAKDWPGRGSSLSVPFFERPRFTSRDVRRGAHS